MRKASLPSSHPQWLSKSVWCLTHVCAKSQHVCPSHWRGWDRLFVCICGCVFLVFLVSCVTVILSSPDFGLHFSLLSGRENGQRNKFNTQKQMHFGMVIRCKNNFLSNYMFLVLNNVIIIIMRSLNCCSWVRMKIVASLIDKASQRNKSITSCYSVFVTFC